jgi:sugar lactone lactonase YvrE
LGGPGLATLYITASTSVYRIETNTRGLPAF